ncbi:hypothetical protein ABIB99_002809, partial [Bradyrhizobium sp. LA6.1]|uniref:hypothetical protein n=1 Tax=Bradyrhizobium sp. LA6.1 TaxID=3156378 RepID=UPI00339891F3
EALHPRPPQIVRESYRENHVKRRVFTQPGSKAVFEERAWQVRSRRKPSPTWRLDIEFRGCQSVGGGDGAF